MQWTMPIVLGLLAAGLTFVAAPDEIQIARGGPAEVRTQGPYVLVPSVDHEASLLRYGAAEARHGLGGILDIHAGHAINGVFWWDGNGWECRRAGASCPPRIVEPIPIPARAGSADTPTHPEPPRLEQDGPPAGSVAMDDGGHGATKLHATVSAGNATVELTFYLFTSSGHLLGTNAPRSSWEHFDLHGQFTRFSSTTWHLGTDEPPAGARSLPMFRQDVFSLLEGTPAGGVQSAVLETHPYDWLLGPVWATARVDALVSAP